MKLYKYLLALSLGLGTLTSCEDKLEVTNPNQQTTGDYGYSLKDLQECVIAAYNHTRMEGSYARVGYNIDVMRGDEAWNCSQVWYMPFDDLNEPITDEIGQWSWREWYYTLNVCNFIITRGNEITTKDDKQKTELDEILGQALFLRGLAYYNLAGYYQNPALILDYGQYSTLDGLFSKNYEEKNEDPNLQYERVMAQVATDFRTAKELLPTKDKGGEWAKGRANKAAAAGYLARTLMAMHDFQGAYVELKAIIDQQYGKYKLTDNYGDNFREGPAYENNEESIYEVQFLDKDSQGKDDEWTPVNTSPYATQGSAIESNFAPGDFGGWADIAASPWLYNLFKEEKTKDGKLDPRLYWTIGTYEIDWEGFENGNVCYNTPMTADNYIVVNNNFGGLPIAKWTHFRTGEYDAVAVGLHDGINLRLMRYADVLLRAAECINEIGGDVDEAVEYINMVRRRANLKDLDPKDFDGKPDKLFEQIANVERPKEFGCEFGRGFDLLRWGWFYSPERLEQLRAHAAFNFWTKAAYEKEEGDPDKIYYTPKDPVEYPNCSKTTFAQGTLVEGHEFLPIYQGTLDANANLVGNSANFSSSNASWFASKGWKIHPVVK